LHFLSSSSVLQLGQVRMRDSAAGNGARAAVRRGAAPSARLGERLLSKVTARILTSFLRPAAGWLR